MAKRGTLSHPKTLILASELGIEQAHALGLLEGLWHFAAAYAPQGDIGRFSNAAIAQGIGTRMDPDTVMEALMKSGYVDRHRNKSVRATIHDWRDHADESVKKKLERSGIEFISVEKMSRRVETKSRHGSPHAHKPEPTPVGDISPNGSIPPTPEPIKDESPNGSSSSRRVRARTAPKVNSSIPEVDRLWEEFCFTYPKREGDLDKVGGQRKFRQLVAKGEDAERILEGCKRYRAFCDATLKTKTQFVKSMPRWLNGRAWEEEWEIPDDAPKLGANGRADKSHFARAIEAAQADDVEGWA